MIRISQELVKQKLVYIARENDTVQGVGDTIDEVIDNLENIVDDHIIKVYNNSVLKHKHGNDYTMSMSHGDITGTLHDYTKDRVKPYSVVTLKHEVISLFIDGRYICDYASDANFSLKFIKGEIVVIYVNGKYNTTSLYYKGVLVEKDVIHTTLDKRGLWIETPRGITMYNYHNDTTYYINNVKLEEMTTRIIFKDMVLYEKDNTLYNIDGTVLCNRVISIHNLGNGVYSINKNNIDLKGLLCN